MTRGVARARSPRRGWERPCPEPGRSGRQEVGGTDEGFAARRRSVDAAPSETAEHSVGHPGDFAARHRSRRLRRLRLQGVGADTAASDAGARADLRSVRAMNSGGRC